MKLSDLLPLISDDQNIEVKSDIRVCNFRKKELAKDVEILERDMEIKRIQLLGNDYEFILHIELESSTFKKELAELINRYSLESGSDTPDFILANYLSNCLVNFDDIIKERDKWYNFKPFNDVDNKIERIDKNDL